MWAMISTIHEPLVKLYEDREDAVIAACEFAELICDVPCRNEEQLEAFKVTLGVSQWLVVVEVSNR